MMRPQSLAHSIRGYTTVELLITLMLVAILTAASVPGFRSAMQNSKLTTELERLTVSLRLAQSVAARSGNQAITCVSSNGVNCTGGNAWHQGWIVLEQDDVGTQRVITIESASNNLSVRAIGLSNQSQIVFNPEGTITDNAAPGTFVICDSRGADAATAAIITRVGLVREARDSNNSGVVEGAQGTDISC